jgi:hypothetical protein
VQAGESQVETPRQIQAIHLGTKTPVTPSSIQLLVFGNTALTSAVLKERAARVASQMEDMPHASNISPASKRMPLSISSSSVLHAVKV